MMFSASPLRLQAATSLLTRPASSGFADVLIVAHATSANSAVL